MHRSVVPNKTNRREVWDQSAIGAATTLTRAITLIASLRLNATSKFKIHNLRMTIYYPKDLNHRPSSAPTTSNKDRTRRKPPLNS